MKTILVPVLLSAILAGLLPAPSRGESVALQWEKIFNAPGLLPTAVEVGSADNVIVSGSS